MNDTMKLAIKSFFLGAIATIVDFVIFVLCNYLIFVSLKNQEFIFGPFDYEIADGGLCTFISTAVSYLLSQVVNYFVQKKYAFMPNTSSTLRFILYILSSCMVYIFILLVPGVIGATINNVFGYIVGPVVTKGLSNFIGFLIQFPINKFIIFK